MPDIKSELSKVLNQWDKHEETIRTHKEDQMKKDFGFKPTNNVSRETFNYVRDNPFQARRQIKEALTSRGFKEGSIDALLTQMRNGGLISRSPDGTYVAKVQEFQPIKVKTKIKKALIEHAHKAKKTEPPSAGIAALASDTKQEAKTKTSIILNRGWSPEKAIENLNVIQARALYDELKKIFGG